MQDAAAALPALLMGDVKGRRVLDMCAAPGGKTAQLCAMRADVTAVERSPRRAEFLAGNLARVGLKAEIVVADANEWQPEEPFDAVLLDAPCTATGTIRRHPDIPWAKEPADVARLAEAQAKLLRSARPAHEARRRHPLRRLLAPAGGGAAAHRGGCSRPRTRPSSATRSAATSCAACRSI